MLELLLLVAQDPIPPPEYPRPHLVRERWTHLNGRWDYAIRPRGEGPPEEWDGRILVPYCVESAASGVGRRVGSELELWYRRSFRADCGDDERLLLHFGAVDWECEVFVDGASLGVHRGGYDSFSFELPDLARGADHELRVRVWDPTDAGPQPVGKQRAENQGIWYTPVTGIWQTVWLEPVPRRGFLRSVTVAQPGPRVSAAVALAEEHASATVRFTAADGVASETVLRSGLPVAESGWWTSPPDAWSPARPVMNGFSAQLLLDGRVVDEVRCEFAHRTVEVATDSGGHRRVCLNGEPLFLLGTLDQGWWPAGLYTAPSDAALRADLEITKRLGFNVIRKHVKVEPERWYWHAERLGILVWQDLPNPARAATWYPWRTPGEGAELPADAPQGPAFAEEMRRIVAANPWGGIVAWTLYNEAWGQWSTAPMTERLRALAPGCVVDSASGGNDFGTGDLNDVHAYPGPAMPPVEDRRAVVLGEFGGLGLAVPGHLWREEGNWGYRSHEDAEQLTRHYEELLFQVRLLAARGLAGAIYTQTTDVENEINGLLTYDRAVLKMDEARVRAANLSVFRPPPRIVELLPDARSAPREWRWSTEAPSGDWTSPAFDDSAWLRGRSGFGTDGTPGAVVGTVWDGPEIWLRTEFESTGGSFDDAALSLHHDEDVELYLDGERLLERSGYVTDYRVIPLPRLVLAPGRHVLAVHCRQTGGGQYVDAGLLRLIEPED